MTADPVPDSLPVVRHARGPGVVESVVWTAFYVLVQVIAAAALLLVLALFAFEGWRIEPRLMSEILQSIGSRDLAWLSVYVTGGATLGALFVVVPAACFRLRPAPRATLGTHSPDRRQLVLLGGAVLPLAILSDGVYRTATLAWEALRSRLDDVWPALAAFGDLDTMDLIQNQTSSAAYPLLLVIVGVGPAIGEELVFRGVIGRGLINRLGITGGVLLTSLLFALAHGTPAHAAATLPLAIFLHLTYLATRTIWAPILVHFLNNALSVTMLKYGLGGDMNVSLLMFGCAGVYVIALGALLWQAQLGSGLVPRSGGEPVGDFGPAKARPRWLALLATTGVIGFTWTFVTAAIAG
jgi:uncharacterized protein